MRYLADTLHIRQVGYRDWITVRAPNLSPSQPELFFQPLDLQRFWDADLPRSAIVCLQDRTLPFAAAMAMAGRLGVIPQYIDSSHAPFLSRPQELARLLVQATGEAPVAALQPD